jgi:hypothetical protein
MCRFERHNNVWERVNHDKAAKAKRGDIWMYVRSENGEKTSPEFHGLRVGDLCEVVHTTKYDGYIAQLVMQPTCWGYPAPSDIGYGYFAAPMHKYNPKDIESDNNVYLNCPSKYKRVYGDEESIKRECDTALIWRANRWRKNKKATIKGGYHAKENA